MTDVIRERAILGNVLREIAGECRFCHCNGGCCSTEEPGEKCILVGPLQSRCNGFTCDRKYVHEQRQYARRSRKSRRRVA